MLEVGLLAWQGPVMLTLGFCCGIAYKPGALSRTESVCIGHLPLRAVGLGVEGARVGRMSWPRCIMVERAVGWMCPEARVPVESREEEGKREM